MKKMVLFNYSQEIQVIFQTMDPQLKQQSNMSLNPKQESVADPVYMSFIDIHAHRLFLLCLTHLYFFHLILRLKDVCKLESTFHKGKLSSPDSNELPGRAAK